MSHINPVWHSMIKMTWNRTNQKLFLSATAVSLIESFWFWSWKIAKSWLDFWHTCGRM